MSQPTVTIGLTMKDNVFLILTEFTTIIIHTTQVQVNAFIHSFIIHTIITMPFASNHLFHVNVININSPGSNPKSYHINIHIVLKSSYACVCYIECCSPHLLHQSN